MKTTYILGAILACCVIGAVLGSRTIKTVLLLVSGILSGYGLIRLLA